MINYDDIIGKIQLHNDMYGFGGKRNKLTKDFVGSPVMPILDIGSTNLHCQDLEKHWKINIVNTEGNLDLDKWKPIKGNKFNTIFCFEVIEHLMSPRIFLERLKKFMNKDAVLYISYPRRNELFWTRYHFHEYSKKRFLYMVNDAGYDVVKYKWEYEEIKFSLGIRPLFRMTPLGRARIQFYKLRLK